MQGSTLPCAGFDDPCLTALPRSRRRFDLLHVMVDDTDEAADMRIARHIIGVHCHQHHAFDAVPYKTETIQRCKRLC